MNLNDSRAQALGQPLQIHLPELPPLIRYEDEYTEKAHTLRELDGDRWNYWSGGQQLNCDFAQFPVDLRALIKHVAAETFLYDAPRSADFRLYGLAQVDAADIRAMVAARPTEIRTLWQMELAKEHSAAAYSGLKFALRICCKFSVMNWSPLWADFLRLLPLPASDPYSNVRTGEVFLSINEERRLVAWIDERVLHATALSESQLIDTALVICSYQFGMRPWQIGMLKRRDYREWAETEDGVPSVHLAFRMIKQRGEQPKLPLPRKVKREWAPVFSELFRRSSQSGTSMDDHLFGIDSARSMSLRLIDLFTEILGTKRTATDLRHTAAQRFVDAGGSQEELAEFMGHSALSTGLVYYETSPNQAELVNRAMGLSHVYNRLATIAHAKFVSPEELAELKGEQQIGGAPHGIPLTGMGGCTTGQPACPYNPVTSCYGCPKFMPVTKKEIHQEVLAALRSVVKDFEAHARGDLNSPAYVQLRTTIAAVMAIIQEIENRGLQS